MSALTLRSSLQQHLQQKQTVVDVSVCVSATERGVHDSAIEAARPANVVEKLRDGHMNATLMQCIAAKTKVRMIMSCRGLCRNRPVRTKMPDPMIAAVLIIVRPNRPRTCSIGAQEALIHVSIEYVW